MVSIYVKVVSNCLINILFLPAVRVHQHQEKVNNQSPFSFTQVQAKVHAELDRVCGNASEVSAAMRPYLPYTEATLFEIWRCGPVGPIAAVRSPNTDCKVGKHIIPAGSLVFPNLYSMTQDSKLWGNDVSEFRPERFLDETGTSVKNNWWDFTFGTGIFRHFNF